MADLTRQGAFHAPNNVKYGSEYGIFYTTILEFRITGENYDH